MADTENTQPANSQDTDTQGTADSAGSANTAEIPEDSAEGRENGAGGARIEPGADVAEGAELGAGTVVWQHATVREGARTGRNCVIGRGAYLGPGVVLGDNVKVQNQALVYEPAVLENGVFVGPAAVFTNDTHPRAVTPEGMLKTAEDWEAIGVIVREGASIGARAVCVAPVTIGRWALVAAGAVVTRDVPDFGLVAGVPARRIGWVGRYGVRLEQEGWGLFRCPKTGAMHLEQDGRLIELDSDLVAEA